MSIATGRRRVRARLTVGRFALLAGVAVVALLPFVTATPSGAATPTVSVSGYSATRSSGSWGITESCLATTRGYLADTASFGPSGVVKATLNVSSTGVDTASASSLTGVQVFFTGYVASSTYTSAEKTALLNYVKGGGALIGTTDATNFDMSDIFGMTLADSPGGLETGTITDASSPLAAGPFGTVTTFKEYDSVAHWTNVGPGHTVGTNPEGPAIVVIPPGALSTGSGPVVMVSDVDVFSDCGGATPEGSVANEVLIKNIFAYVASFEAALETTTTTSTASTTTTAAPATTTTAAPTVAANPAFTG